MKSSKETQNPSRTSITLASGTKAFLTHLRGWKYTPILHYSASRLAFCTLIFVVLKKAKRQQRESISVAECGFCSKNTLSSWMPQACKWARAQFAFWALRNTLNAISPVTKTQLSPGTKSSKAIICVLEWQTLLMCSITLGKPSQSGKCWHGCFFFCVLALLPVFFNALQV